MPGQTTQGEDKIVVELSSNKSKDGQQIIIGKRSNVKPELEEFRGIPYGIVPARWHHATLRERLPSDVFDATSNGPSCCQPPDSNNTDSWQSYLEFPSDVKESEFDCLNLFITRPSKQILLEAGLESQVDHLPVYVYIHGGGYAFGAGTDPMWNPARLVSRSVELRKPFVAVNINYRLNIFGFAASSDIIESQGEHAKGCNFALTDQRVALEWVSCNIAAFGGDPQRITVGGQSAGATSAHVHILDAKYSPDRPLIARGIIQSAAVGALGPVPLAEAGQRWNHLCEQFGAASLPAAERVAKLASVPAHDLLEVAKLANWGTFPIVHDEVTVTNHENGEWKFSLEPHKNGNLAHHNTTSLPAIDVLIGDTDVEGSVYRNFFVTKLKTFAQLKSAIMSLSASESAKNDIMQVYKFDTNGPVAVLHDRVYSFLTDIRFGIAVDRAWHKMSTSSSRSSRLSPARQTRPIQYRIQFGNPFDGPNHNVAQHCVDLIYIYDCFHDDLRATDSNGVTRNSANSASNHALVELLQSDWINFITARHTDMPADASEDDIIIYDRDRRRTVIPKGQDQEYQERQIRFEVLEKHWDDANKIFNALRLV